ETTGTDAAESQLGACPLRLDLDPAREDVVGKGEDEEQEKGKESSGGQEQAAQHRIAREDRQLRRHQDPCQALTLRETSSRSLFSYAFRMRKRPTRTTPGLCSMPVISSTSLSSETLP